ncbi:RNA-binding S4 domain-containing protein [Vibrio profundum]|uniref:RNA-binding S4 domain-containing protein n=1 Tax=Vibrio profundum TaxID=2910247 RepID=UPI003D0965EA
MNEYDGDIDHQEEVEIEAIGIEVSSQPIELYKVMKIANLVGGGGEAKHAIAEGYVAVNGELEDRKRRKMYDGDFFEFNQEYYVVLCDAPVTEPADKPEKPVKEKSKKANSEKTTPKKATPQQTKAEPTKAEKTKKPHQQADKKPKKAKSPTKAKKEKETKAPTRDETSGRNSIEFF